jgi:hypothetical protein
MTNVGPLDVLGAIEGGRTYDDLIGEALVIEVAGRSLNVLALAALIELKRGSNQAKDKLTLAVLEETLRRSVR